MTDDYEHALRYLLWGRWDELFTLMLRTNDDILGKRIQLFLHAYYYAPEQKTVLNTHDQLIEYIDHASASVPHGKMF